MFISRTSVCLANTHTHNFSNMEKIKKKVTNIIEIAKKLLERDYPQIVQVVIDEENENENEDLIKVQQATKAVADIILEHSIENCSLEKLTATANEAAAAVIPPPELPQPPSNENLFEESMETVKETEQQIMENITQVQEAVLSKQRQILGKMTYNDVDSDDNDGNKKYPYVKNWQSKTNNPQVLKQLPMTTIKYLNDILTYKLYHYGNLTLDDQIFVDICCIILDRENLIDEVNQASKKDTCSRNDLANLFSSAHNAMKITCDILKKFDKLNKMKTYRDDWLQHQRYQQQYTNDDDDDDDDDYDDENQRQQQQYQQQQQQHVIGRKQEEIELEDGKIIDNDNDDEEKKDENVVIEVERKKEDVESELEDGEIIDDDEKNQQQKKDENVVIERKKEDVESELEDGEIIDDDEKNQQQKKDENVVIERKKEDVESELEDGEIIDDDDDDDDNDIKIMSNNANTVVLEIVDDDSNEKRQSMITSPISQEEEEEEDDSNEKRQSMITSPISQEEEEEEEERARRRRRQGRKIITAPSPISQEEERARRRRRQGRKIITAPSPISQEEERVRMRRRRERRTPTPSSSLSKNLKRRLDFDYSSDNINYKRTKLSDEQYLRRYYGTNGDITVVNGNTIYFHNYNPFKVPLLAGKLHNTQNIIQNVYGVILLIPDRIMYENNNFNTFRDEPIGISRMQCRIERFTECINVVRDMIYDY